MLNLYLMRLSEISVFLQFLVTTGTVQISKLNHFSKKKRKGNAENSFKH